MNISIIKEEVSDMNMTLYGLTAAFFLVFDAFWLGVASKGLYARYLGSMMKSDINWIAAGLFYALYVAGVVYFVVAPAVDQKSLAKVVMSGAFFGFVAYATYDLTNLATLKNWPIAITVIDLAWGAFATGMASGGAWWIYTTWLK